MLFRASGDKEFIRLIAEESLGAEDYRRIRDLAERWKSSTAPPWRQVLQWFNDGWPTIASCGRVPTIAGWLRQPGPNRTW